MYKTIPVSYGFNADRVIGRFMLDEKYEQVLADGGVSLELSIATRKEDPTDETSLPVVLAIAIIPKLMMPEEG